MACEELLILFLTELIWSCQSSFESICIPRNLTESLRSIILFPNLIFRFKLMFISYSYSYSDQVSMVQSPGSVWYGYLLRYSMSHISYHTPYSISLHITQHIKSDIRRNSDHVVYHISYPMLYHVAYHMLYHIILSYSISYVISYVDHTVNQHLMSERVPCRISYHILSDVISYCIL